MPARVERKEIQTQPGTLSHDVMRLLGLFAGAPEDQLFGLLTPLFGLTSGLKGKAGAKALKKLVERFRISGEEVEPILELLSRATKIGGPGRHDIAETFIEGAGRQLPKEMAALRGVSKRVPKGGGKLGRRVELEDEFIRLAEAFAKQRRILGAFGEVMGP